LQQEISKPGNYIFAYFINSEELLLDYGWDTNELDIPENVRCLCGKGKCRTFLMKSKRVQAGAPILKSILKNSG